MGNIRGLEHKRNGNHDSRECANWDFRGTFSQMEGR